MEIYAGLFRGVKAHHLLAAPGQLAQHQQQQRHQQARVASAPSDVGVEGHGSGEGADAGPNAAIGDRAASVAGTSSRDPLRDARQASAPFFPSFLPPLHLGAHLNMNAKVMQGHGRKCMLDQEEIFRTGVSCHQMPSDLTEDEQLCNQAASPVLDGSHDGCCQHCHCIVCQELALAAQIWKVQGSPNMLRLLTCQARAWACIQCK